MCEVCDMRAVLARAMKCNKEDVFTGAAKEPQAVVARNSKMNELVVFVQNTNKLMTKLLQADVAPVEQLMDQAIENYRGAMQDMEDMDLANMICQVMEVQNALVSLSVALQAVLDARTGGVFNRSLAEFETDKAMTKIKSILSEIGI